MSEFASEKRVDLSGFPVNDSPTPVNWRGKVFHVRPIIDMDEAARMVGDVISACYDEMNGVMIPEILDYVFRCAVISYFTDAVLSDDERERYKFIYLTDFYEVILKHASRPQLNSIQKVIETTVFGYKE